MFRQWCPCFAVELWDPWRSSIKAVLVQWTCTSTALMELLHSVQYLPLNIIFQIHQAKSSGKFSNEELLSLKREFQHHKDKTHEYNILMDTVSRTEGEPRYSLFALLLCSRVAPPALRTVSHFSQANFKPAPPFSIHRRVKTMVTPFTPKPVPK